MNPPTFRLLRLWSFAAVLVGLFMFTGTTPAREWSDMTGKFKVEGQLVGINDEVAVIMTAKKKVLGIHRHELSEKDQAYLNTEEAKAELRSSEDASHVWEMRNGLRVIGKVVRYGAQDVTLQRQKAQVHIDGVELKKIPEIYQKMMPIIVSHFTGEDIKDDKELKKWMEKRGAQPVTFHVEGVVLQLTDGEELRVPIFFFGAKEQQLLQPGLERWKAAQQTEMEYAQRKVTEQRESLMAESLARAYQRDRAIEQQTQMMQLGMLSVISGATDMWEVELIPGNGFGYPIYVPVYARDSLTAQNMAMQKYPGYQPGIVRKVAGY